MNKSSAISSAATHQAHALDSHAALAAQLISFQPTTI